MPFSQPRIAHQNTNNWHLRRSFTDMNILILRFKEAEDISVLLIRKKEHLGFEKEVHSN